MFTLLFTIALIFANIYFFTRKKYLYLFIPCMLFLPDYYGFVFSVSTPIITVTRLMYVVLFIYTIIYYRRSFSIDRFKQFCSDKNVWLLCGYFVLRIVSNLRYSTTYSDSLKVIFSIVFEELLLLVVLYAINPSKQELHSIIKIVVWTATVLFAIGIFESFTHIRPFDMLYTVSRDVLNESKFRLGMLRSVTTMSLSNFYGNMCLFITPLILYLLRVTGQKRYILSLFLNVLAIVHSGCRSDMLFFLLIVALFFIHALLSDQGSRAFITRSLLSVFAVLFIWIFTMSTISADYRYYYTGTGKSVLNVLGFDFDLDEDSPDAKEGFGGNRDGVATRRAQLSGITYTLRTSPLFGLGAGCENRKEVHYYYKGRWSNYRTIDIGLVEIVCTEGVIGLIGFFMLFLGYFCVILSCRKHHRKMVPDDITAYLLLAAYLLGSLSTANMFRFLTLLTAIIYASIKAPETSD